MTVYVIDFRSDETGVEESETFGTEARARKWLREMGLKPDGGQHWISDDGDLHAFVRKVAVR